MIHLRQQRTITRAIEVNGFGYWSGRDVCVQFRPAPADSGLVFVRRDLDPPKRIAAHIRNRVQTPRRTNLAAQGASVQMVEHVMAALGGMQIDNCQVWVDQPEMPGCDGSSLPFVEALAGAGIVVQDAPRARLVITQKLRVGDDASWVEARPAQSDGLFVDYCLDYAGNRAIGRQRLRLLVTPDAFRTELAPARTFLLKHEAQWLQQQGLGARVSYRDVLVFDDDGPVENRLRFPDECVRHKTLDLIGDLALAGCDFVGQFHAHRSGHRQNAQLVRALLAQGRVVERLRRTA